MTNLLVVILYLAIGSIEWWLALRRTLACARGEKTLLVSLVFIENLLGLFVLSMFVRDNNWWIAVSYAVGGSLGCLFLDLKKEIKNERNS